MILWKSLNLWAEEERHIHKCLTEALQELITQLSVKPTDDEKTVTGALRPILRIACKHGKLNWSVHFEASSFERDTDPNPSGHPDIQFARLDKDNNQYNYDVECKLVRIKRPKKSWDYCAHYVKDGVIRYQSGKYAQSDPPMGTMLGYVQEGDFSLLLNSVNKSAVKQGLSGIRLHGKILIGKVTKLSQKLHKRNFTLHHLWGDFC
ncbi:MAG: hypothetical protein WCC12_16560 [Anaerolineales bacterium]